MYEQLDPPESEFEVDCTECGCNYIDRDEDGCPECGHKESSGYDPDEKHDSREI